MRASSISRRRTVSVSEIIVTTVSTISRAKNTREIISSVFVFGHMFIKETMFFSPDAIARLRFKMDIEWSARGRTAAHAAQIVKQIRHARSKWSCIHAELLRRVQSDSAARAAERETE